jgi:hypothetical protein
LLAPFFVGGWIQGICPDWLWTKILMISTSQAARFTCMSYQGPAAVPLFISFKCRLYLLSCIQCRKCGGNLGILFLWKYYLGEKKVWILYWCSLLLISSLISLSLGKSATMSWDSPWRGTSAEELRPENNQMSRVSHPTTAWLEPCERPTVRGIHLRST